MDPALSDEADPLYQPLEGLEAWNGFPVDEGAWAQAVERLRTLQEAEPDWYDMVVGQGALLAAAVCPRLREVALSLLRGDVRLGSLPERERSNARANYEALLLARDSDLSEASIRRVHEVACRHQLTHRVRVGDRVQDHVLAPGDYKHHPNHVPTPAGWHATAPVTLARQETAKVVDAAASAAFAGLHPVVQAAFLCHALTHVQPFAAGNGRVARALASGVLLRSAGIPLFGDVLFDQIEHASLDLVELVHVPPSKEALERWRAESDAASALRSVLVPAVESALDRHQQRQNRRADLSGATIVAGEPLLVRVSLAGRAVDEALSVDAHPVDGPMAVRARDARLAAQADAPLDPFLDRVVAGLALRVAADLEDLPRGAGLTAAPGTPVGGPAAWRAAQQRSS